MADFVLTRTGTQVDDVVTAGNNNAVSSTDKLFHDGASGVAVFNEAPPTGAIDAIVISADGFGEIATARSTTASARHKGFYNPNGLIGSIITNGTVTSFNTSSDPRLKDFKGQPADDAINDEFDKLYSCFDTFNWKNDPTGQLVWGFDAHLCIDAKLGMGSEGEGPRDLALGDIYDTTPAELDENGNEIKPAIEHKASPAGIDQAKAVPILLAKIEQLERRLVAAGI